MIQALSGLGLGGIASGQSGYSDSFGLDLGGSQSNSWNNEYSDNWSSGLGESWSNSYGENYTNSYGESWSNSENFGNSWNEGASSNAVYGSEASAKDVLRALEANAMQEYFNQQQMKYNTEEAQKARVWEEYMSNTSYQRAVADLKKAGLNPILAAINMGASTPTAAYGSSGLATASKATTYADQRGSSYTSGASNNYGYSKSGSYNKSNSYGYNKSDSYGYNKNQSEGHSRGAGGSQSKSSNIGYNKSHSESTNNMLKAIEGIGDFFNGITSAFKNAFK